MVLEISESAVDVAVELGCRTSRRIPSPRPARDQILLGTPLSHLEAAHKNGPVQTRGLSKNTENVQISRNSGRAPFGITNNNVLTNMGHDNFLTKLSTYFTSEFWIPRLKKPHNASLTLTATVKTVLLSIVFVHNNQLTPSPFRPAEQYKHLTCSNLWCSEPQQ